MAAAWRPKIVLVVAHDMGFSDMGCYGSGIETPNLHGLARRCGVQPWEKVRPGK